MFSVARPQLCSARYSAGCDQSIAQLNRMALAVASQIFSGTTADGGICGNAEQSVKQSLQCAMFRRASASPEFGGTDGGEKDQRVGSSEFEPLRHDGLVPASRDLDQNIRIG